MATAPPWLAGRHGLVHRKNDVGAVLVARQGFRLVGAPGDREPAHHVVGLYVIATRHVERAAG